MGGKERESLPASDTQASLCVSATRVSQRQTPALERIADLAFASVSGPWMTHAHNSLGFRPALEIGDQSCPADFVAFCTNDTGRFPTAAGSRLQAGGSELE